MYTLYLIKHITEKNDFNTFSLLIKFAPFVWTSYDRVLIQAPLLHNYSATLFCKKCANTEWLNNVVQSLNWQRRWLQGQINVCVRRESMAGQDRDQCKQLNPNPNPSSSLMAMQQDLCLKQRAVRGGTVNGQVCCSWVYWGWRAREAQYTLTLLSTTFFTAVIIGHTKCKVLPHSSDTVLLGAPFSSESFLLTMPDPTSFTSVLNGKKRKSCACEWTWRHTLTLSWTECFGLFYIIICVRGELRATKMIVFLSSLIL